MTAQPILGVKIEYNVPAKMRDGVILRSNVFRPDDGGAATYPVLLTRLPYGKDLPLATSFIDPAQVARCGYIVVIQDVRGTFTSEGPWYPFKHEQEDGLDTVAWAAKLPGSNGKVGMYGASYFGQTQWLAATAPELGAMAPMITWADGDETALRNGVFEWGLQASWLLQQALGQVIRRNANDPEALGRAIYAVANAHDTLPTKGYDALPLEQFGPLANLDLHHPIDDVIRGRDTGDFGGMRHGPQDYDNINLPMLHVGGWYDIFLKGTIRNFQEMQRRGREGQYLVIGPWTHGMFGAMVGDVYYGMASSGALMDYQIDLASLHVQFFDHWLKQAPGPFDRQPAVRYFVLGANVWKSSDTWPPAHVTEQRWYLHSGGRANSAAGDGSLSLSMPTTEPADSYSYDPQHPTPTVGGPTLMHGSYRAGPLDQSIIEARQDTLVYTSKPLDNPLEVAGPVSVTLYVATDAPDTDFVARLVDVDEAGRAINIVDGIVRMHYREGVTTASAPLTQGQAYKVEIDLWSTSVRFLAGHRLRIDVTSSSFPRWERNLNTGKSSATTTEMRTAQQTILHDSEHPSFVSLSVVPVE